MEYSQKTMALILKTSKANYARYEQSGDMRVDFFFKFLKAVNAKPRELDRLYKERLEEISRDNLVEMVNESEASNKDYKNFMDAFNEK